MGVLSAVAWAAHIFPGVSARLALTGQSPASERLAVFIAVLVVGTVLAIWLTKLVIELSPPSLTRFQMALGGRANASSDWFGYAIEKTFGPGSRWSSAVRLRQCVF
jgi:hypothetical protein